MTSPSLYIGLPPPALADNPSGEICAPAQHNDTKGCRPGYPKGCDCFRVLPFVAVRNPFLLCSILPTSGQNPSWNPPPTIPDCGSQFAKGKPELTIHFPPSANDATLKRTVAPADVFNALSELELDSFRPRLEQELEAYTEIKADKRKAKKADANGGTGDGDSTAAVGASTTRAEDEDVEMEDNPAKRVKRDGDESGGGAGQVDGDETQEEDEVEDEGDEEEEEGEGEEAEDEDEEDEAGRGEEDVDRVEDLDGARRRMDPDADETDDDDDDGPASQLRDDLGLG